MLVTLLVQFGLGMYSNLFITIPSNHPGAGEHNYFTATARGVAWLEASKDAPVVVATHVGVGVTLVIGAVWMVTLAFRTRARPVVSWSAVLGGLFILGAAINGGSFLDYNNDVNSFLMAMFFAAAVACYGLILAYPAGKQPAPGTEAAPEQAAGPQRVLPGDFPQGRAHRVDVVVEAAGDPRGRHRHADAGASGSGVHVHVGDVPGAVDAREGE